MIGTDAGDQDIGGPEIAGSNAIDAAAVAAEILRQTAARGAEKSICPSEVARALAGGGLDGPWRPLMGRVRTAALQLAEDGRVVILRKGKPLPLTEPLRGVIRLRAAPPDGAANDGVDPA